MDIQNAFNSVDRNAFFAALRIAGVGLAFVLPFVRGGEGILEMRVNTRCTQYGITELANSI